MKTILTAAGVVAFLGLGLLMADVKEDYSHSAHFANYHTFYWLKVDAANPLWTDRIKRAVDAQLTAKGWTEQPNGQIAVSAMGRTKNEQSYNTFYDDMGGGWMWGPDTGISTTNVENVPVGTLIVDLFDAKTKKLLWRGVATNTLSGSPEKNEKKLQQETAKMFRKFPPKNAS